MNDEAGLDNQTKIQIKMTEDGFPILPNDVVERELSKKECEIVLREYLGQHYCEFGQLSTNNI
jgi:hypothetical protein